MTEQTATTQSTTTAIQLPGYGDRKEVKELADRIKMMLPGGTHYTNEEALTLAQIGIAHNLDPFNGEVWLIKDEEKGKVYGALVGIKGHRKHAKVQANYWGDFKRIVDPKDYNAPEGAIVFEYIIRDEKTLEGWTKSLASLLKAGLKLDEATGLIGKAPTTIGLGIWSPGDKTKMKPAQCAMFRAEKDALKRRFDVKFKIEIGGQDLLVEPSTEDDERDLEALEGEYEEVEPTEGEEPRDDAEILEELGFGQKPQEPAKKNGANLAQKLVDLKLAVNIHSAHNVLSGITKLADDPQEDITDEDAIELVRWYRGWRDTGATTVQAFKMVNEGKAPK